MAVTARMRCFFYERRPPLTLHFRPLFTPTHKPLNPPQDDTAPWHSERQGTVERNYTCVIVGESTKYRGTSRPPTRIIASLLKFLWARGIARVSPMQNTKLPSFGPALPVRCITYNELWDSTKRVSPIFFSQCFSGPLFRGQSRVLSIFGDKFADQCVIEGLQFPGWSMRT